MIINHETILVLFHGCDLKFDLMGVDGGKSQAKSKCSQRVCWVKVASFPPRSCENITQVYLTGALALWHTLASKTQDMLDSFIYML